MAKQARANGAICFSICMTCCISSQLHWALRSSVTDQLLVSCATTAMGLGHYPPDITPCHYPLALNQQHTQLHIHTCMNVYVCMYVYVCKYVCMLEWSLLVNL